MYCRDKTTGQEVDIVKLDGNQYLVGGHRPRFITAAECEARYTVLQERRQRSQRARRRDGSGRRRRDFVTPGCDYNLALSEARLRQHRTMEQARRSGEHQA